MAPLIHNLGGRWRSLVNITFQRFYSRECNTARTD